MGGHVKHSYIHEEMDTDEWGPKEYEESPSYGVLIGAIVIVVSWLLYSLNFSLHSQ